MEGTGRSRTSQTVAHGLGECLSIAQGGADDHGGAAPIGPEPGVTGPGQGEMLRVHDVPRSARIGQAQAGRDLEGRGQEGQELFGDPWYVGMHRMGLDRLL